MTKAESTLQGAVASLESALTMATRSKEVTTEDHQRLRNAATQAAQAAAELNRLVGMVEGLV